MQKIEYKLQYCHACDIEIMVKATDLAPRNYCATCAWAKLGAMA
jgi:hypothetical protein